MKFDRGKRVRPRKVVGGKVDRLLELLRSIGNLLLKRMYQLRITTSVDAVN